MNKLLTLSVAFLLTSNMAFSDEGVTYDSLNLNGMLPSAETSWLSKDDSTLDGYNFKTCFTQGAFVFSHYWSSFGFGVIIQY